MYTLSETYRRNPLTPAVLANQLYRPSYLSGLWALGHYDLIPERVVRFTSVTPRVPRRFRSPRLDRAVQHWLRLASDAEQGTESL